MPDDNQLYTAPDNKLTHVQNPIELNRDVATAPDNKLTHVQNPIELNRDVATAPDNKLTHVQNPIELKRDNYTADTGDFQEAQLTFNGKWMPNEDPLLVGAENYTVFQNMRYDGQNIEGVQGYTQVNDGDAALSGDSRPDIDAIIQIRTQSTAADTSSVVLAHAVDSLTTPTAGKIYRHNQDIPDTGAFVGTEIFEDGATSKFKGRFSEAPLNSIAYANGQSTYIWSGDETEVAKVLAVEPITSGEIVVDCAAIANASTITWSSGGSGDFVADGFKAGQTIGYTGSLSNTAGSLVYLLKVSTTILTVNTTLSATTGETMTIFADVGFFKNAKNITNRMVNSDTAESYTFDSGVQTGLLVMTKRPTKSIKIYVSSANTTPTTTLAVKVFEDANEFSAAGSLGDGTASGGTTFATTGSITFTPDDATFVTPYYDSGTFLYTYYLYFNAILNGTITQITYKPFFQEVKDLWDGVYRNPIVAQFFDHSVTKFIDYSLDVNVSSAELTDPLGIVITGMEGNGNKDYIILGFSEPVVGFRFTMVKDSGALVVGNNNRINVFYYSAGAVVVARVIQDETTFTYNGETLTQNGIVFFVVPIEIEKTTFFGVEGYFYKIFPSVDVSSSSAVIIDTIEGITMTRTSDRSGSSDDFGYLKGNFTIHYKDRLFIAYNNYLDFSGVDKPEVWNGDDSSDWGKQRLFFGNNDPLIAGGQIYNRFGSNLYSMMVIVKHSATYILTGGTPSDFQIFPVSSQIGCVAPNTFAVTEIGRDVTGESASRSIALWVSHKGPILFDGGEIVPITGIENFFDENDSDFIASTSWKTARGWYDSAHNEYNIVVGTKWFAYDLVVKGWLLKDTMSAALPTCGYPVKDASGREYIYAGVGSGRMARLENGTEWDGPNVTTNPPIHQVVQTGNFLPTKNIWDESVIRRFKLLYKTTIEANDLRVSHNAVTSSVSITDLTFGTNTISSANTDFENDTTMFFAGEYLTITACSIADNIGSYLIISVTGSGPYVITVGDGLLTASTSPPDSATFTVPTDLVSQQNGIDLENASPSTTRYTGAVNLLAWDHKFRFETNTALTTKGMELYGWGYQYGQRRKDIKDGEGLS